MHRMPRSLHNNRTTTTTKAHTFTEQLHIITIISKLDSPSFPPSTQVVCVERQDSRAELQLLEADCCVKEEQPQRDGRG